MSPGKAVDYNFDKQNWIFFSIYTVTDAYLTKSISANFLFFFNKFKLEKVLSEKSLWDDMHVMTTMPWNAWKQNWNKTSMYA